MRRVLPVWVAAAFVAVSVAGTAYWLRSGEGVDARTFDARTFDAAPAGSPASGSATLNPVTGRVDQSLGTAVSAVVDSDTAELAGNARTWGSGEIDREGDIGAKDRARFTALALAHIGELRAEPMVVRWYLDTAGSPVADSSEVAAVAKATFADDRGWKLRGAVTFQRVEFYEEADFVLLVAEAAVIPGYSEECVHWETGEPDASCTVGSLVIINDLRWRDGALGDPIALAEFRVHELNHEVGHWLGQGHFSCLGGLGAVNQQQFRSLAGCRANGWPLRWEMAMVAARFGLWPSVGAFEPYDSLEGDGEEMAAESGHEEPVQEEPAQARQEA